MPDGGQTYVMLPGSDGRASTWNEVVLVLREQGNEVVAVDGWETDGLLAQVAAVTKRVAEHHAGTLVTWSYSGFVGAMVAARPSDLRLVVHVDALLPGVGRTRAELESCLPRAVLKLLGDDIDAATSLPSPCCRAVYVSCVNRVNKPSLAPVARSAALAGESGLDVFAFQGGHQAMRQRPTELARLLSELTDHDRPVDRPI